jgi:hypothetical protein
LVSGWVECAFLSGFAGIENGNWNGGPLNTSRRRVAPDFKLSLLTGSKPLVKIKIKS